MHTPEQARGLWCPHVRGARLEQVGPAHPHTEPPLSVVGSCNTDALGGNRVPASCRCIADQCAMWRWHEPYKIARRGFLGWAWEIVPNAPKLGYCGLAGTPVGYPGRTP